MSNSMSLKVMRPICELPDEACRGIQTIFTDIDDTLTEGGRVPAEAYSALWRAREAGLDVVLVTGRPAGWCDALARQWPVSAVVGENGALAFAVDAKGVMRRLWSPRPDDAARRLAEIQATVLAKVPGARVAADQAYRAYDLAIDFAEEVSPPLPEADIDAIVDVFVQAGATAKVSSIHVNGWYGDFDKLSMCRRMSPVFLGRPLDVTRATFVGDSPNDVPMFQAFPYACGVSNVRSMADRMTALPAFITEGPGGVGFAEVVDRLLAAR